MGVNGLWKLIEPVGKPIPLESLENKVLAVGILCTCLVIMPDFDRCIVSFREIFEAFNVLKKRK
jgi:hypothetical protein